MPLEVDELLARAQELEQALRQRELHVTQQPVTPKFHQPQSPTQTCKSWDSQSERESTCFKPDYTAAEHSYELPAQQQYEEKVPQLEVKPPWQQENISPADFPDPEAKKEEKEPATTDPSHAYDPSDQANPLIIDSILDYPPLRSHSLTDTAPPPPYSPLRQSPSSPQLRQSQLETQYPPQSQPQSQRPPQYPPQLQHPPQTRKQAKPPSKNIRAKDYEQTLRWLAGRRGLGRKVKG